MLLWQLTLILLYIVWSIFSIITIIKRPKDILKDDLVNDINTYPVYITRTPCTNIWIMFTTIISCLLIVYAIFQIPWFYKVF